MSRQEVLVDADWVEEHRTDDNLVLVEVDEDTTAYDGGHIAGAIKLDWKTDLQDPVRRDFVNKEQFEKLLSERGISNDDTIVLYGGNNNWFAAYAYWYFKLYGHEKVLLLDGGRKKWELDARELSSETVTRPAATSSLACSRERARPRRTSSWSSRRRLGGTGVQTPRGSPDASGRASRARRSTPSQMIAIFHRPSTCQ